MDTALSNPRVVQALALAIPAILAAAAALGVRAPFLTATFATKLTTVLAAAVALGTALLPAGREAAAVGLGLRLDVLTSTMLLLVSVIGLLIVRFSRHYMAGDPGTARYSRWMLATLAAVSLLVSTDHLLVLALAWTATSLALHQLLTFYPRPAALVAAHKKFLVSRLADVCLLSAIGLVYSAVGSFEISAVLSASAELVETSGSLPLSLHAAGVLFVLAACLKSAQLPFHGWLMQVMEAPTPVSALLHAGVVNIGGFLMIRLSPLMGQLPVAQLLLVSIGLTTALIAALVMTTRVSIKVALAWSTCAQMGLMLVQCGLGVWHLALLHLVAHSLYKAHSFLSAGRTVESWRISSLMPRAAAPVAAGTAGGWLRSAVLAAGLVIAVLGAMQLVASGLGSVHSLALDLPTGVLALFVALSLVPLLNRAENGDAKLGGSRGLTAAILQSVLLVTLYFGWHAAAAALFGTPMTATVGAVATAGWILVAVGVTTLFAVHAVLRLHPNGRWARALQPWLFAGLYLDERFTLLTFRLWPPRLPTNLQSAPAISSFASAPTSSSKPAAVAAVQPLKV